MVIWVILMSHMRNSSSWEQLIFELTTEYMTISGDVKISSEDKFAKQFKISGLFIVT